MKTMLLLTLITLTVNLYGQVDTIPTMKPPYMTFKEIQNKHLNPAIKNINALNDSICILNKKINNLELKIDLLYESKQNVFFKRKYIRKLECIINDLDQNDLYK